MPHALPDEGTHPRTSRTRPRALMLALVVAGLVAALVAGIGLRTSSERPAGEAVTEAPLPAAPTRAPVEAQLQPSVLTAIPPGLPTPETTGPRGELRPYGGPLELDRPGTTLSGVIVEGCVSVLASDVTIRDSVIRCDNDKRAVVRVDDGAQDALLEHVEIDGMRSALVGVAGSGFVVRAADVHSSLDGIRLGSDTVVEGSYVHGLSRNPGVSHNDVLQSLGGSGITVRGNSLIAYDARTGQRNNSVLHLRSHRGRPMRDVVVEGNYLDGGGYTVNVGQVTDQSGIVLRDNLFSRNARWGPVRVRVSTGVTVDGNLFADDRQPVPVQGPVSYSAKGPR